MRPTVLVTTLILASRRTLKQTPPQGVTAGKGESGEAVDISPVNAPRKSQKGPERAFKGGLEVSKLDAPGHRVIRFYS